MTGGVLARIRRHVRRKKTQEGQRNLPEINRLTKEHHPLCWRRKRPTPGRRHRHRPRWQPQQRGEKVIELEPNLPAVVVPEGKKIKGPDLLSERAGRTALQRAQDLLEERLGLLVEEPKSLGLLVVEPKSLVGLLVEEPKSLDHRPEESRSQNLRREGFRDPRIEGEEATPNLLQEERRALVEEETPGHLLEDPDAHDPL